MAKTHYSTLCGFELEWISSRFLQHLKDLIDKITLPKLARTDDGKLEVTSTWIVVPLLELSASHLAPIFQSAR